MSNILFVWELGENWGHLSRDLPVARRLRAAGHQVVFAVRNTVIARDILGPADIPFLQAPISRHLARPTQVLANHAEMLIAHGYGELESLRRLLMEWHDLFRLFLPDIMVLDYAPTALLAARSQNIRAVLTGNGFELPPRLSPIPSFRPWKNIPEQRLLLAEEVVLRNMNRILTDFQARPFARFADLFDAEHKILTTFEELDHYGERTGQIYTGPVYELPDARTAQWPETGRPRIFAYLRPAAPNLASLLQALAATNADVICSLPGVDSSLLQRVRAANIRVFPTAVALENLLPTANLAVGYGSGFIATSLLSGVPLLLTPYLVEHFLSAQRVEALGAGLTVHADAATEGYAAVIATLLDNSRFQEAAKRFAEKYHDFDTERAADFIAGVIQNALSA